MDIADLPGWAEMSDLDRGATLLHIWKRAWEGAGYARGNYPCQYLEHPRLIALSRNEACRHAVAVCSDDATMRRTLGDAEYDRLYDLALRQGQLILDARKMWGIRFRNGNIMPVDTGEYAARMVDCPTGAVQLLRRTGADEPWKVLRDTTGREDMIDWCWVETGDGILLDGRWVTVLAKHNAPREETSHECTGWLDLDDGSRLPVPSQYHSQCNPESGQVYRRLGAVNF